MKIKYTNKAFALPVVMIASVVMMMVLVSGLSATTSVNSGLRQQHSARLQKSAAEAGLAMAKACIKANNNTITWTNASPLKPNTDCNGTETTSCPVTSTNVVCYVAMGTGYRTTFSVIPVTDSSENITGIDSQGRYRSTRSFDNSTVKEAIVNLMSRVSGLSDNGSGVRADKRLVVAGAMDKGTSCAVADGKAYCWGVSDNGEAGSYPSQCTPYLNTRGIAEPCLIPTSIIPASKTVVSISLASYGVPGNTGSNSNGHACATTSDGSLYCWGNNYFRETGGHNNAGVLNGKKVGLSQDNANPFYIDY